MAKSFRAALKKQEVPKKVAEKPPKSEQPDPVTVKAPLPQSEPLTIKPETIKEIQKPTASILAAAKEQGLDPERVTGIQVDTGIERKKQSTRLLKALCSPCDWSVRITAKQAARGLPHCPLCGEKIMLQPPKPSK